MVALRLRIIGTGRLYRNEKSVRCATFASTRISIRLRDSPRIPSRELSRAFPFARIREFFVKERHPDVEIDRFNRPKSMRVWESEASLLTCTRKKTHTRAPTSPERFLLDDFVSHDTERRLMKLTERATRVREMAPR